MKQLLLTTCTALLLFACNNESSTTGSDSDTLNKSAVVETPKEKEQAWIPVDSATNMQAMMAYGTPGEPHKMLAKSAGKWTGEMKMWMFEGSPAYTTTVTSVNNMILGDKFLQAKHTGNFDGMPFEGIAVTGYDNASKQYVSSWIDNMSSGFMNMTGDWNEATKSITFTGKQKSMANGLMVTYREVFKFIDDNNQIMEMYGPDPKTGKEYKLMEVTYKRK